MLREETREPDEYPRIEGLTPEELTDYNRGYAQACRVLYQGEDYDPKIWVEGLLQFLPGWIEEYDALKSDPWYRGGRDAYAWALAELKTLDTDEPEQPDTVTISTARYNYLLDMEKSVDALRENFGGWQE